MGEPLFDGLSAAIVGCGGIAIVLLQLASGEATDSEQSRRLGVVGHLLLGVAVSLLLYRWSDGVMSLPSEFRPNVWRSGALAVACGIGLVAAVKAAVGPTADHKLQNLCITFVCGASALFIAAAWEWALLVLALVVGGIGLSKWNSTRSASTVDAQSESVEQIREPALVLCVSAAFLLLLLGTWQHVIVNETQRTTRSTRYSAWPRVTALRNAWERTDWTVILGDAASASRVADQASREQSVALGMGALWVVLIAAVWCKRRLQATESEAEHAG